MTAAATETTPQIKGVSFDLDDTLYDYGLCHRKAIDSVRILAKKKLGLDREEFSSLYAQSREVIHARLAGTAASHSRLLYFSELVFRHTHTPSSSLAVLLEKTYWTAFYRSMRLYPGVFQLLKTLRSRAVKVALLTDMTAAIQFEKLERLKLENMFDVILTSEEAGCEKPNPTIFRLCLQRLGLPAASVVHVGDDVVRDISGGRAAGVSPILFISENKKKPPSGVKAVRSFFELSALLMPCRRTSKV